MEWKGDETRLGQLCQLFQLASSPDNSVQQQVMQMLQQFSQLPDFNMYLATVFAKLTSQDEVVRQRAGLLLKTNVGRCPPGTLQPAVAEYVQAHALSAVRDSSKVIRHTAGTVISILVLKVGIVQSRPTLDQLAGCLGDHNADTVEGSFNALNKICEDGMMLIKQTWDYPDEQTQHFVSWSAENFLPKVMQYASPQAPLHARQNAIECLNHFALNWAFNEPKFPQLQPYAAQYLEVLGVLANDQDPNVLKDVCKGFVCVIENQWNCVTAQTASVVLQYMLKACRHPEYMVRVEALEVWTPCTNSPMLVQCVWSMLKELIPVLLENMVYSQADYMAMEHAMWEDDNAAVPDAAQDIKPRTHKEQGDEEDEDGGAHNGGGAWGAEWTARKAAASSLDNLSHMYREGILEVVLPLISRKLEHESWEVQESGVLALGAIAFGCMDGLTQYMPKVMEHLLKLCQAPKPLLRSISCWTVARFSNWICNDRMNRMSEQVLRAVLQQLLLRVLDKNKRVQEAACSAFATLEETARHLLVPYLEDIVSTLSKAFQYYQAKNLLILYDAVGTLADSVGPELDTPRYKQQLLEPLFQKFNNTLDNDRSIIALFECLSSLAANLGPSFGPLCKPLVERCSRLIMNGAQAAQMWMQNPNEFEKPDREVMAASIDLLSGIVAGLRENVSEVLQQQNFLSVVPEVLKDTALQGSCESPRLNTTALAAALGSGAWPASPAEATVTPADTAPLTPAPVAVEASEPAKPEPAEFNASSSGFLQRVPEEEVRLDKLPRPFYCDPLEHVIVINLQDERGKPKRDSLAQELEKAGINSYNFFPAVDHEIDEQLKSEMSAQDPQLCDTLPKCKSTLGRALSHRQVHEKIIAEQWSCAMILEDHAKLAENFTSRLREVARDSFPGFDVIQLGRCEAKGTGKDAPPKDQSTVPTLFQGWPGRCAHAYVASIYGAVSMAQANTPISLGRDVLLSGNHKYENRFRAHVDHKKPAGSYWYTDPALSWPSE